MMLLPGRPPLRLPLDHPLSATGAVKAGQKQIHLAVAFQDVDLLRSSTVTAPPGDNPALLRPPNAFTRIKDCSAAEPGHVVLLEYMEQQVGDLELTGWGLVAPGCAVQEGGGGCVGSSSMQWCSQPAKPARPPHLATPLQPPLLNRPGMGAKLVTYYRKRDAADTEHTKLKQGALGWRGRTRACCVQRCSAAWPQGQPGWCNLRLPARPRRDAAVARGRGAAVGRRRRLSLPGWVACCACWVPAGPAGRARTGGSDSAGQRLHTDSSHPPPPPTCPPARPAGQLPKGASSLSVETGLFRSLAYAYDPPSSDFLLLRSPVSRGGGAAGPLQSAGVLPATRQACF